MSVDKALLKYYYRNKLMMIIGSIVFFPVLFFVLNYFPDKYAGVISFLLIPVFLLLFGVFYAFFLSNIWTFWVFNRVKNVHELKNDLS